MNAGIRWWQPLIGDREEELVRKVLASGFLNDGDVTLEFERQLAQLLQCAHVVTTTSGTTALFLSLKAIGIGPGDEVLVPDVTFIATANAVTMAGAKAVLVDVDPQTLNICPQAIARAINSKTRAIIPVHVSGRSADLAALEKLSVQHNLTVIEDAAEAFLSGKGGRMLGTIGKMGCFSLSPNKTITTGQGGFIATNDAELNIILRQLKDQGRPVRGTGGDDLHPAIGFNCKFTNLQAAVGLAQLDNITWRCQRLKELYNLYKLHLQDTAAIRLLPFDTKDGESPQWVDALVQQRQELHDFLLTQGMECRKFWHPIHRQDPYRLADAEFPVSSKLSNQAIWLPSSLTMSDDDVERTCRSIKSFYKTAVPTSISSSQQ